MIHLYSIWLLAAGFLLAGFINVIGTSATRRDFAMWGFPAWWGRLTGALEIVSAVLIALPASRLIGLALGAVIVVAALVTVLRHRDFKHLPPLGIFVAVFLVIGTTH
jgi:hypothetical protein